MKTALLSLFAFGAILSADPVRVSYQSADPSVIIPFEGGVYAGPYTLNVDGTPTFAMCMDDFRGVNGTWTANVTSVGSADLSKTVLGNNTTNIYGYQLTSSDMYRIEATLFQQLMQPGADRANLQLAAWSLMDPTTLTNVVNSNNTTVVNDLYAAYDASANINASGFQILSDTSGSNQEFMVASPEPASYALFGAGLIATGAARFFRRKKIAA